MASTDIATPPEDRAASPFSLPIRHRKHGIVGRALVDPDVYEWAQGYNWYLNAQGYVCRRVYVPATRKQWRVRLHREVMGLERGDPREVDHRSQDKTDNRRSNLRVCTHAENLQNRGGAGNKGSVSKYRGVTRLPDGRRWRAQVTLNYKNHHVGVFETEEAAAKAAANFRREHMPFTTN